MNFLKVKYTIKYVLVNKLTIVCVFDVNYPDNPLLSFSKNIDSGEIYENLFLTNHRDHRVALASVKCF